MNATNLAKSIVGLLLIGGILAGLWFTRDTWTGWVVPTKDNKEAEKKDDDHHKKGDTVKLTEQAQRNLRLVVKEVKPTTYWRKISLPGTVVDRPGRSDRAIPAPIGGVVTQVKAVPGKTIRVGDELFRLRVASESFQTSQMELFKSTRELEIAEKELKRLQEIPGGAIPITRLLELEYQRDRFKVLIQAYRQDLQTRQLTKDQIVAIEKGEFVTEFVIRMPDRLGKAPTPQSTDTKAVEYEMQELKVNLGDHVQAGQILAYVADHRFLYIEGRALKQEAKLLAQAAKEHWPVEADFADADDDLGADRLENLTIEFLGNTMDAAGLTLPVYVPFANPMRDYERQGKTYRTGLFRPGQKVLLKVAVSKLDDVFVLPINALVREGPEAYVFRQSGNSFDRRPVHVLLEDADVVVIANDGSIIEGQHIGHNAAAALFRVLKAQQAEGGGGHHHHDH